MKQLVEVYSPRKGERFNIYRCGDHYRIYRINKEGGETYVGKSKNPMNLERMVDDNQ